MLSKSAGSHNNPANCERFWGKWNVDRRWTIADRRSSVRPGAERFHLAVELFERMTQLLPTRGVGGRLELPAELGVGQPERFGTSQPFGIVVGLGACTPRALLFPLVHALLNAVLRVD
jgi:hypothetical protein